jgi:hypothetical protein
MSLITNPSTFLNGQVADAAAVTAAFNTVYNDYNGNVTDANLANTGITTYGKVNGTSLSSLGNINSGAGSIPAINLQALYPIGTIYSNVSNSANPATLFGFGTWVAIEGYVVAGYKSGDANFGTPGGTVGAASINIAHTHTATPNTGTAEAGGGQPVAYQGAVTTSSGLSATQSVIQPTLVAYCWKRTA